MDDRLRELERQHKADPTPMSAERLLHAYRYLDEDQPGNESLRYLDLLLQWGPELREHGEYMRVSGHRTLVYPRLTPEQTTRYRELYWQTLLAAAEVADSNLRIDLPLLQRAETLAHRNNDLLRPEGIYEMHVFVITHQKHRAYRAFDRLMQRRPYKDNFAEIHCTHCDDSLDLYGSPEHYRVATVDYDRNYRPDAVVDYDAEWREDSTNTLAIEFLQEHQNCIFEEEYIDPWEDVPPDTPSLPPVGTQDPHWRRNPDEEHRNLERYAQEDPEIMARYLVNLVRQGKLERHRLVMAAMIGHTAAGLATGITRGRKTARRLDSTIQRLPYEFLAHYLVVATLEWTTQGFDQIEKAIPLLHRLIGNMDPAADAIADQLQNLVDDVLHQELERSLQLHLERDMQHTFQEIVERIIDVNQTFTQKTTVDYARYQLAGFRKFVTTVLEEVRNQSQRYSQLIGYKPESRVGYDMALDNQRLKLVQMLLDQDVPWEPLR